MAFGDDDFEDGNDSDWDDDGTGFDTEDQDGGDTEIDVGEIPEEELGRYYHTEPLNQKEQILLKPETTAVTTNIPAQIFIQAELPSEVVILVTKISLVWGTKTLRICKAAGITPKTVKYLLRFVMCGNRS